MPCKGVLLKQPNECAEALRQARVPSAVGQVLLTAPPMRRILLLLSLLMLAMGPSVGVHAAETAGRAITPVAALETVSDADQPILAAQDGAPQHKNGGCAGPCCHVHCGGCHGHSLGLASAADDLVSDVGTAMIPPIDVDTLTLADRLTSELRPPIA